MKMLVVNRNSIVSILLMCIVLMFIVLVGCDSTPEDVTVEVKLIAPTVLAPPDALVLTVSTDFDIEDEVVEYGDKEVFSVTSNFSRTFSFDPDRIRYYIELTKHGEPLIIVQLILSIDGEVQVDLTNSLGGPGRSSTISRFYRREEPGRL